MKHKIKVKVPVEKRGFLGIKKTGMETRTIEVDGKTYKKMKNEEGMAQSSVQHKQLRGFIAASGMTRKEYLNLPKEMERQFLLGNYTNGDIIDERSDF